MNRYGSKFNATNALGIFKGHVLWRHNVDLLSVCINEEGEHFMVMFCDMEDDFDQYYYIPMSIKRKNDILKGKVSLREMFTKSESETIFLVEIYYGEKEGKSKVIELKTSEIDDDRLPPAHSYHNFLKK